MAVIKNRASFAEHAAPEAVAIHLKRAQKVAARARAEVRWLSALLAQKTADQVAEDHECLIKDGRCLVKGCTGTAPQLSGGEGQ